MPGTRQQFVSLGWLGRKRALSPCVTQMSMLCTTTHLSMGRDSPVPNSHSRRRLGVLQGNDAFSGWLAQPLDTPPTDCDTRRAACKASSNSSSRSAARMKPRKKSAQANSLNRA